MYYTKGYELFTNGFQKMIISTSRRITVMMPDGSEQKVAQELRIRPMDVVKKIPKN